MGYFLLSAAMILLLCSAGTLVWFFLEESKEDEI